MKTVVVICQKGGVGKSTTALNMGACLARGRKKVLLVDLDAQGNLSATMGADPSAPTSFNLIEGSTPAHDVIQHLQGMSLIAAGPNLTGADMNLKGDERETFLARRLRTISGPFDYCIIDTPPALGVLTISALIAADTAIIPVQADPYSLQALGQLSLTLDAVRKPVAGVLLTRYSPRSILARDMTDMAQDAAKALGTTVFKSTIREAVAIRESQAYRQSIFEYAPKSAVADDYRAFTKEFINRIK